MLSFPAELLSRRYEGEKCPGCGGSHVHAFYAARNVPVHSVLLMPTPEAARSYPRGDVVLGYCQDCGFIFNLAFDAALHEYSERYEETQGYSPTFDLFHRRLAARLIERYDLHGKRIIEIGCGKGEFLRLLCDLGGNEGVGFDPSYVAGRDGTEPSNRITFVRDFYSEKYADVAADFICCKMTLEHIANTGAFAGMVRRAIGSRPDVVVFIQVPDVTRILEEIAFWDVYYEHCSYFSPSSLAQLFRHAGFDVLSLEVDYGGQYVMLEARRAGGPGRGDGPKTLTGEGLTHLVSLFEGTVHDKIADWTHSIRVMAADGMRIALWGGGSKAVAFLTTLGVEREIARVVDINPHRQGTFIAGTGQEIVAPETLIRYRPDLVIIMNPVYRSEIRKQLENLDLAPRLVTIVDPPPGRSG